MAELAPGVELDGALRQINSALREQGWNYELVEKPNFGKQHGQVRSAVVGRQALEQAIAKYPEIKIAVDAAKAPSLYAALPDNSWTSFLRAKEQAESAGAVFRVAESEVTDAIQRASEAEHAWKEAVSLAEAAERMAVSAAVSSTDACMRCGHAGHVDLDCPNYKAPRSLHRDAWRHYGKTDPRRVAGEDSVNVVVRGKVLKVRGDGHCLYHSLVRSDAQGEFMDLRRELAAFVSERADLVIEESTIADWVWWDQRCSPQVYSRRQAVSGDGGGIEIAIYAHLKRRQVHVYERRDHGFVRISLFRGTDPEGIVNIVYNGCHYDALLLEGSIADSPLISLLIEAPALPPADAKVFLLLTAVGITMPEPPSALPLGLQ